MGVFSMQLHYSRDMKTKSLRPHGRMDALIAKQVRTSFCVCRKARFSPVHIGKAQRLVDECINHKLTFRHSHRRCPRGIISSRQYCAPVAIVPFHSPAICPSLIRPSIATVVLASCTRRRFISNGPGSALQFGLSLVTIRSRVGCRAAAAPALDRMGSRDAVIWPHNTAQ